MSAVKRTRHNYDSSMLRTRTYRFAVRETYKAGRAEHSVETQLCYFQMQVLCLASNAGAMRCDFEESTHGVV